MSSGLTRKHDPANVIFTFGAMAASGVAKGSFMEVDRYEDAAKLDIGSDGEATVIVSNNNSEICESNASTIKAPIPRLLERHLSKRLRIKTS